MGLSNPTGKSITYLRVNNGKFVKRLKQQETGCISRTLEDGKVIYEMAYQSLDDIFLKDAKVVENDKYNTIDWCITFEDSDGTYQVTLPYNSGMTTDLLLRLRNTDLGNAFTLKVYKFVDDKSGKDKTRIVIYQNGEKITADWTDVPAGKEIKKGRKVEYDTSDRSAFIEDVVLNSLVPFVKGKPVVFAPLPEKQEVEQDDAGPDDDSDLPF